MSGINPCAEPSPFTWRFPGPPPTPPATGEIQSANDGFEFLQSANDGEANMETAN